jgi:hypothetical protein
VTFPLLRAHKARTAAFLETLSRTLPGNSPDLADLRREISFRNTVAQTRTSLLLVAQHPDEPASEMVSLARYAIEQSRGGRELDVEQPPMPADTGADELVAEYRRVLELLLEGAMAALPSHADTFEEILLKADVRKSYLGPLAALFVVDRCRYLPSSTIARFALEALNDCSLPLAGPNGRAPSTNRG